MSDITEIFTNSSLRARAIESLKGDGIRPLEEAIAEEEGLISGRKGVVVFEDNDYAGYGINENHKDLFSEFKGRGQKKFDMNYNILRQVWNGLNYVERDGHGVPHEMLSAMNTFEIVALYRAFAKLKKHGKIEIGKEAEKRAYSFDDLRAMPVEDAVSKMIGYGCARKAVANLRGKGWNYFPTGRGDLKKRIMPMAQSVKDRFSLLLDPSLYEGVTVRQPTAKKNIPGKKIYIDRIAAFAQDVYDRNTTTQKA